MQRHRMNRAFSRLCCFFRRVLYSAKALTHRGEALAGTAGPARGEDNSVCSREATWRPSARGPAARPHSQAGLVGEQGSGDSDGFKPQQKALVPCCEAAGTARARRGARPRGSGGLRCCSRTCGSLAGDERGCSCSKARATAHLKQRASPWPRAGFTAEEMANKGSCPPVHP